MGNPLWETLKEILDEFPKQSMEDVLKKKYLKGVVEDVWKRIPAKLSKGINGVISK